MPYFEDSRNNDALESIVRLVKRAGIGDIPESTCNASQSIVSVTTPIEPESLSSNQRNALIKGGFAIQIADGSLVVKPMESGLTLCWPIGIEDSEGRPLPFLCGGVVVIPSECSSVFTLNFAPLELRDSLIAIADQEGVRQ